MHECSYNEQPSNKNEHCWDLYIKKKTLQVEVHVNWANNNFHTHIARFICIDIGEN